MYTCKRLCSVVFTKNDGQIFLFVPSKDAVMQSATHYMKAEATASLLAVYHTSILRSTEHTLTMIALGIAVVCIGSVVSIERDSWHIRDTWDMRPLHLMHPLKHTLEASWAFCFIARKVRIGQNSHLSITIYHIYNGGVLLFFNLQRSHTKVFPLPLWKIHALCTCYQNKI